MNFTGLEYLKIDIANAYGHDKMLFNDRINFVNANIGILENFVDAADEPMLYLKAVKALRKTEALQPSGHTMALDATASGLQVMAALSGCKNTATHVNMVNTNKREDVYTYIAKEMNMNLPLAEHITRAEIKKPLMTH